MPCCCLFADKAFLPQDRCGAITLDMGIFVPVLMSVTLSFTGRKIPYHGSWASAQGATLAALIEDVRRRDCSKATPLGCEDR